MSTEIADKKVEFAAARAAAGTHSRAAGKFSALAETEVGGASATYQTCADEALAFAKKWQRKADELEQWLRENDL